jgi:C-terminal processing protease CtpA/Prc
MQAFHADSAENRRPLNHIGIQVQPSASGYLVTAVLEGYPAHLAGINRGDIIQSVNAMPYHPVYSFNAATSGPGDFPPSNTSYEITWRRNDGTSSASLMPVYENLYDSYRSATLNSIQVFPSGNKLVGYVRLWGFSRSSNDLVSFRQILAEFDDCDGLIIDLRNAYGFLGHQHLDLIFPSRRRLFQLGGVINEHVDLSHTESAPSETYYQKPIAVLLNSATAGGAELFAY